MSIPILDVAIKVVFIFRFDGLSEISVPIGPIIPNP